MYAFRFELSISVKCMLYPIFPHPFPFLVVVSSFVRLYVLDALDASRTIMR
jgi:hypothetical protein